MYLERPHSQSLQPLYYYKSKHKNKSTMLAHAILNGMKSRISLVFSDLLWDTYLGSSVLGLLWYVQVYIFFGMFYMQGDT